MAEFHDDQDVPSLSIEQLGELLNGDPEVPRVLRRSAMSDARRAVRRAVLLGYPPEAMRFRALRCVDCGCIEVSGSVGAFKRHCH